MEKREIIKNLKEFAKRCKKNGDMDGRSHGFDNGVKLSGHDALWILERIEENENLKKII